MVNGDKFHESERSSTSSKYAKREEIFKEKGWRPAWTWTSVKNCSIRDVKREEIDQGVPINNL